jgi:hypothetical protein
LATKLQKNLVTAKRFWKINAIRPKIKARRGRMKMFNLAQKANWGGLVKELGFLFVTRETLFGANRPIFCIFLYQPLLLSL